MKKLLFASMLALVAFSSCSKDDKDDNTPVDETMNTWQFTAGTQTYKGKVATAVFQNLIGAQMTMVGTFNDLGTDTTFNLSVRFEGNKIDTGSYSTEFDGTSMALMKLPSGDIIYAANFSSAPYDDHAGQVIKIHVTSYDSTSHVVTGTFTGNAYTFDEETVPVTNGSFKATVKQL